MQNKIPHFLLIACIASIVFVCNAFATSYSLVNTWSDAPYVLYDNWAYHWDDWSAEWDAKAQQSDIELITGNSSTITPIPFKIISNSGISGEKVAVSMTLEMNSKIAYGNTSIFTSPIGNEQNFAGFDTFDAWIDYQFGVDNQTWTYSANTTNPWANIYEAHTVTVQTYLDTYTDYDFNMDIVGHCMINASGLKAYDPDQDFGIQYGLQGLLKLTDISISPITVDEEYPLLFLVCGFVAFAGLKKRMVAQ